MSTMLLHAQAPAPPPPPAAATASPAPAAAAMPPLPPLPPASPPAKKRAQAPARARARSQSTASVDAFSFRGTVKPYGSGGNSSGSKSARAGKSSAPAHPAQGTKGSGDAGWLARPKTTDGAGAAAIPALTPVSPAISASSSSRKAAIAGSHRRAASGVQPSRASSSTAGTGTASRGGRARSSSTLSAAASNSAAADGAFSFRGTVKPYAPKSSTGTTSPAPAKAAASSAPVHKTGTGAGTANSAAAGTAHADAEPPRPPSSMSTAHFSIVAAGTASGTRAETERAEREELAVPVLPRARAHAAAAASAGNGAGAGAVAMAGAVPTFESMLANEHLVVRAELDNAHRAGRSLGDARPVGIGLGLQLDAPEADTEVVAIGTRKPSASVAAAADAQYRQSVVSQQPLPPARPSSELSHAQFDIRGYAPSSTSAAGSTSAESLVLPPPAPSIAGIRVTTTVERTSEVVEDAFEARRHAGSSLDVRGGFNMMETLADLQKDSEAAALAPARGQRRRRWREHEHDSEHERDAQAASSAEPRMTAAQKVMHDAGWRPPLAKSSSQAPTLAPAAHRASVPDISESPSPPAVSHARSISASVSAASTGPRPRQTRSPHPPRAGAGSAIGSGPPQRRGSATSQSSGGGSSSLGISAGRTSATMSGPRQLGSAQDMRLSMGLTLDALDRLTSEEDLSKQPKSSGGSVASKALKLLRRQSRGLLGAVRPVPPPADSFAAAIADAAAAASVDDLHDILSGAHLPDAAPKARDKRPARVAASPSSRAASTASAHLQVLSGAHASAASAPASPRPAASPRFSNPWHANYSSASSEGLHQATIAAPVPTSAATPRSASFPTVSADQQQQQQHASPLPAQVPSPHHGRRQFSQPHSTAAQALTGTATDSGCLSDGACDWDKGSVDACSSQGSLALPPPPPPASAPPSVSGHAYATAFRPTLVNRTRSPSPAAGALSRNDFAWASQTSLVSEDSNFGSDFYALALRQARAPSTSDVSRPQSRAQRPQDGAARAAASHSASPKPDSSEDSAETRSLSSSKSRKGSTLRKIKSSSSIKLDSPPRDRCSPAPRGPRTPKRRSPSLEHERDSLETPRREEIKVAQVVHRARAHTLLPSEQAQLQQHHVDPAVFDAKMPEMPLISPRTRLHPLSRPESPAAPISAGHRSTTAAPHLLKDDLLSDASLNNSSTESFRSLAASPHEPDRRLLSPGDDDGKEVITSPISAMVNDGGAAAGVPHSRVFSPSPSRAMLKRSRPSSRLSDTELKLSVPSTPSEPASPLTEPDLLPLPPALAPFGLALSEMGKPASAWRSPTTSRPSSRGKDAIPAWCSPATGQPPSRDDESNAAWRSPATSRPQSREGGKSSETVLTRPRPRHAPRPMSQLSDAATPPLVSSPVASMSSLPSQGHDVRSGPFGASTPSTRGASPHLRMRLLSSEAYAAKVRREGGSSIGTVETKGGYVIADSDGSVLYVLKRSKGLVSNNTKTVLHLGSIKGPALMQSRMSNFRGFKSCALQRVRSPAPAPTLTSPAKEPWTGTLQQADLFGQRWAFSLPSDQEVLAAWAPATPALREQLLHPESEPPADAADDTQPKQPAASSWIDWNDGSSSASEDDRAQEERLAHHGLKIVSSGAGDSDVESAAHSITHSEGRRHVQPQIKPTNSSTPATTTVCDAGLLDIEPSHITAAAAGLRDGSRRFEWRGAHIMRLVECASKDSTVHGPAQSPAAKVALVKERTVATFTRDVQDAHGGGELEVDADFPDYEALLLCLLHVLCWHVHGSIAAQ